MNDASDWDGFRVLLAVAERGSVSAGAKALNVSQPTAGRRIEALEAALGVRLLVRKSRGVVPTPAGEEVLAEARRMAEGAHAALRRVKAEGGEATRTVRVAVTEGLGTRWLPPRLAGAQGGLRGVRLELLVDNATADLSRREADVAVRLFRPKQLDLVTKKVGTLGLGLFASPAYLAQHGTPRRVADLARHLHVGYVDRGMAVPPYLRWHRTLAPHERFPVAASSVLAMAELARAGLGIVVATAALYAGDPGLVRVLPTIRPPPLDVWLTTHSDVRRDAAVARVVDTLTALFGAEAKALAG